MGKKKGTPQTHTKSKLILKADKEQIHYKMETIIEFKCQKSNPLYKKALEKPLFPTFNNDKKYFTPTFILPQIQTVKQQQWEKLHSQKVDESLKQIDQLQIMMPKPRSKNKYCGVCRSYYEEYAQHNSAEQHKRSLQNSMFHKYIGNLCLQFQQTLSYQQMYQLQKNISIQTKLNDDQNSTESIIQHKKDKDLETIQICTHQFEK